MELDDLKTAWREMEQRLAASETLNRQLLQETRLVRARGVLRRFGAMQAVELAFWFAVVVTVAPFWIEHRDVPHFLVSGIVLHAYGVAAICLGVTRLLMIVRTGYTESVLAMQSRLDELARVHARINLALGLPWWWLWVPLSIVAGQWGFGADVYARSPAWVFASLGVGVAGMFATLWIVRRHARKPFSSRLLRTFLDNDDCGLHSARQHLDAGGR